MSLRDCLVLDFGQMDPGMWGGVSIDCPHCYRLPFSCPQEKGLWRSKTLRFIRYAIPKKTECVFFFF